MQRSNGWDQEDLFGLTRPSSLNAGWPVPVDVKVTPKWVSWDRIETELRNGRVTVEPTMLERFAALATSTRLLLDIEDFAADFGVLGVDESGTALFALSDQDYFAYRRTVAQQKRIREPVAAWKHWSSRVADALLVIGAISVRKKPPRDSMLRLARAEFGWNEETVYVDTATGVRPQTDFTDAEVLKLGFGEPHRTIASMVTTWLRQLGVGVGIDWTKATDAAGLTMTGSGSGFLAMVVFQLALTATRTALAITCSGCGKPFSPARAPRPGQRAFCQDCRDAGVPVRLAQRDYVNRKTNGQGEAK